jgi:NitT/TauT family transport system substrate-binding protein
MHLSRPKTVVVGILTGLLVLAACGSGADSERSADEGGLTTVKGPVPSAAADLAAYRIAVDKGIFKKHGIKLETVSVPNDGTSGAAALLNGQLDVGGATIVTAIQGVGKGLDLRALCAFSSDTKVDGRTVWDTLVPADSDVQSYADLEGKTVAVVGTQGSADLALNAAVTKDGGDWKKVKYVSMALPDQVPALLQGKVDAVYTLQPFVTGLLAQGARSIGNAQAFAFGDDHVTSLVVTTSQKFLDRDPKAAAAFVEALQEASDYANEHPDEVKSLLVKATEATGPAAQAIQGAVLPVFTTKLDASTVDRWSGLMVDQGLLKKAPKASDVLWNEKD